MLLNDPEFSQESNKDSMALAQKLLHMLLEARRISIRPAKLTSWALDIQRLYAGRSAITTQEEVEKVLKWLEGKLKDKYTPVIFSAKTFRAKFPQIHQAMKRDLGSVQISDEAIKLTKQLNETLRWKEDITPHVEYQLRFAKHFFKILDEFDDPCSRRIAQVFGNPSTMVRLWMEAVHPRLYHRFVTSSGIEPLMLGPNNRKLNSQLGTMCVEFGKPLNYATTLIRKVMNYEG